MPETIDSATRSSRIRRTNRPSIFKYWTGNRFRCASELKPQPKSSSAILQPALSSRMNCSACEMVHGHGFLDLETESGGRETCLCDLLQRETRVLAARERLRRHVDRVVVRQRHRANGFLRVARRWPSTSPSGRSPASARNARRLDELVGSQSSPPDCACERAARTRRSPRDACANPMIACVSSRNLLFLSASCRFAAANSWRRRVNMAALSSCASRSDSALVLRALARELGRGEQVGDSPRALGHSPPRCSPIPAPTVRRSCSRAGSGREDSLAYLDGLGRHAAEKDAKRSPPIRLASSFRPRAANYFGDALDDLVPGAGSRMPR